MRSCACWGVGLAALHFSATDSCTAAAAGSCASSTQAQCNTLMFHDRHCKAYRIHIRESAVIHIVSQQIHREITKRYRGIQHCEKTLPWHSGAYTCRGHKQRAQAAGNTRIPLRRARGLPVVFGNKSCARAYILAPSPADPTRGQICS